MDSLDTEYEEVRVQLWTHDRGDTKVTFSDSFLVTSRDTEATLKEALQQDLHPGSKLHIGHVPKGITLAEVEAKNFEPKKEGRVTISQVFQQIEHFFHIQLPTVFVTLGNIVILIADMPRLANNVDVGIGALVPYHGTPASTELSGGKTKKGRGTRQTWMNLSRQLMLTHWPRQPVDKLEEGLVKGLFMLTTDPQCMAICGFLWNSVGLLQMQPLWVDEYAGIGVQFIVW